MNISKMLLFQLRPKISVLQPLQGNSLYDINNTHMDIFNKNYIFKLKIHINHNEIRNFNNFLIQ